jgi:hypothetical protein
MRSESIAKTGKRVFPPTTPMSFTIFARVSGPLRCTQTSASHFFSFKLVHTLPTLCTQNELLTPQRSTTRGHATHRDASASSLLTSALDQKQRSSQLNREDAVGPFQLGISQASLRRGEKAKKWSELSTGGKGPSYLTSMSFFFFFLLIRWLCRTIIYEEVNVN